MRARAEVVVAWRGGRSRLVRLRSDPPLTLRETLDGVRLVGSGAGPVGGDDLGLVVRVEAGASLTLGAVAASLVLPGARPGPSALTLDIEVGEGGSFRYLGAPQVLVARCDHRVSVRVRLAANATFVWRDEVVLGRHDEATGSLHQRVVVDLAGGPLLRSDLAVGPAWAASEGPAVLAGAGAVGTVLLVAPGGAPAVDLPEREGVRAAASALEGPATLVTALARSGGRLAEMFDALGDAVGPAPVGRPAPGGSAVLRP